MKEFIDKLIERLEEEKGIAFLTLANTGNKTEDIAYDEVMAYLNKTIEIVNQLAEEHNNGCCEWEKVFDDDIDSEYKPSCSEDGYIEITGYFDYEYCPYCGKEIKVAPYQPKGE